MDLFDSRWSRAELVKQDVVAVGGPEGVIHFLAISNLGGLPPKQVLCSMELIAGHVIPRFRGAPPGRSP